tara:strand:- start:9457 stop:10113 length:657 start_codon:yes stop_codon:yes gene_type:complete
MPTNEKTQVIIQKFEDIHTPELENGAIYNDDYDGFHQDYLITHCLIKKYQPKKICEIGTHFGLGTYIIKNASGQDSNLFSLDLKPEQRHLSEQWPGNIGHKCKLPFTQLWGDSKEFDFTSLHPFDAFYCDAEHTYENVLIETKKMIDSDAWLIIYHDSDIDGVYKGIIDGFNEKKKTNKQKHILFRVIDTRIMYALSRAKFEEFYGKEKLNEILKSLK